MDAIITVDAEQHITVFNRAAEKIFGYREEQVLGKPLDLLIPNRFHAVHRAHVRTFGETGVTARSMAQPGQVAARRADGEEFPIEATISQLSIDGQKYYTVILRDVAQRQLSEHALRESEKLAATGRLAATIAHEINNPLESITNVLYLLEKYPKLDVGAREYVVLAQKELQRVVHITRQTLGFYREAAQAGEVELAQIVEDALGIYERKFAREDIHVIKRFDSPGRVCGFAGELRQVIVNLLSNALDALPSSGSVQVHIYDSRDWRNDEQKGVRVVVADNGAGITARNLQRVFDPFFTTKGEKGTGLGLWVIAGIVRKHGGRIRVRSSARPGHSGTCFSLFFPVEAAPVREAGAA
jgi:two-component system CheB/CheR fusion protein